MSPRVIEEGLLVLRNTTVLYLAALVGLRLMGKRSLDRLSPFDILILIMMGEVGAVAIEDTKTHLLVAVAPIAMLVLFQVGLSFVSVVWKTAERLAEGQSTVLGRDGQLDDRALRSQRISRADVEMELRQKDAKLDDVKELRIVASRKFSTLLKPEAKPLTARELETILERVLKTTR